MTWLACRPLKLQENLRCLNAHGFITGVSSGFGRELADQVLQRGDRVVGRADIVSSTGCPVTEIERQIDRAAEPRPWVPPAVEPIAGNSDLGSSVAAGKKATLTNLTRLTPRLTGSPFFPSGAFLEHPGGHAGAVERLVHLREARSHPWSRRQFI